MACAAQKEFFDWPGKRMGLVWAVMLVTGLQDSGAPSYCQITKYVCLQRRVRLPKPLPISKEGAGSQRKQRVACPTRSAGGPARCHVSFLKTPSAEHAAR